MGAVFLALFFVGITISSLYGWRELWPASHWYELRAVHVDDGRVGGPVRVVPDRSILRAFNGSYTTTVRNLPDLNVMCSGGETVRYREGVKLRASVDLDWWTAGALPPCTQELVEGSYVLTTCIHVKTGIPLVGERTACVDSNIFNVFEAKAKPNPAELISPRRSPRPKPKPRWLTPTMKG
ncbi:hypothetical protein BMI86_10350 [Thioclava sp. DLFJ5-1]|nr:hypothetical protein BMI86_10350 [Thioclava sp. DLFJ5-1]